MKGACKKPFKEERPDTVFTKIITTADYIGWSVFWLKQESMSLDKNFEKSI